MSQLGERLRTARESQGIGLSQAAVETRILQRYLVALEEGDYQHLPGDVYARGFIRNYAEYLGLSPEEFIELYRRERGSTEPIRVVPATSSPRIKGMFIPSFFGVFFIVLAFVCISYLALTVTNWFDNGNQIASAPSPTAPPPSPLPTYAPAPTTNVLPTPVPTQGLSPPQPAGGAAPEPTAAAPTPTPEAPIIFDIQIEGGDHQGSWLSITADGAQVYEDILGPDQSLRVPAQQTVALKAGNAGVVLLTINGQPYGSGALGGLGKVVSISYPPQ
jgi:cytoskeletal protein RodZ